jgi:hypothetical protein
VRDLFFNDTVRYLNVYPLVADQRSLPVPLSWHKEKDAEEVEGEEFYDFIWCDENVWKNVNSDDNAVKNAKNLSLRSRIQQQFTPLKLEPVWPSTRSAMQRKGELRAKPEQSFATNQSLKARSSEELSSVKGVICLKQY